MRTAGPACRRDNCGANRSSIFSVGRLRRLSVSWPAQNHVLLCPAMDSAAMRAGELLRFQFGRAPALLLDGLAGIGQP